MNCQEYESRVDTLARGALADASVLAEASAHEESCATCAARLADERALSTGLRALASGMSRAEAPARAESALLAAFRARAAGGGAEDPGRAGATADAANAANVVPLRAPSPVRRWSWVKTAAVASLAAAASLALFVLVRPDAGGGGAVRNQSAMIEPPPGAVNGQKPPAVAEVNRPVVEDLAPEAPAAVREGGRRPAYPVRPRAVNASYGAVGGAAHTASPSPAAGARPQEVATEFFPLTQGGPLAQAEEAHLVRVELPRSALASFGLPVNAEAAGGRVKADVLLGEDGTARAIRFIR